MGATNATLITLPPQLAPATATASGRLPPLCVPVRLCASDRWQPHVCAPVGGACTLASLPAAGAAVRRGRTTKGYVCMVLIRLSAQAVLVGGGWCARGLSAAGAHRQPEALRSAYPAFAAADVHQTALHAVWLGPCLLAACATWGILGGYSWQCTLGHVRAAACSASAGTCSSLRGCLRARAPGPGLQQQPASQGHSFNELLQWSE